MYLEGFALGIAALLAAVSFIVHPWRVDLF
jgi:hypothetical protein